jgi:hypothetical protein
LQALSSNISFNVRPCLPGQSISSSSSSDTLCYMCAAPFFSFNAYESHSATNSTAAAAMHHISGSGAERLQISLVESATETLGACLPCPARGICVAGMVIPSQVRLYAAEGSTVFFASLGFNDTTETLGVCLPCSARDVCMVGIEILPQLKPVTFSCAMVITRDLSSMCVHIFCRMILHTTRRYTRTKHTCTLTLTAACWPCQPGSCWGVLACVLCPCVSACVCVF